MRRDDEPQSLHKSLTARFVEDDGGHDVAAQWGEEWALEVFSFISGFVELAEVVRWRWSWNSPEYNEGE